MTTISTDYLVIGSGAMGMAFSDVLLEETDATITIVDRRDRPGGHWNDAYPFVRLHQPSAFYGVNSAELSSGKVDEHGWNEGFAELASGFEVLTYFDRVMNDRFLPSGRVRHLPMHEFADGRATSIVTGASTDIDVSTRTVDCTYMNVKVPSTSPPRYPVEPGVACIPPNGLPRVTGTERLVVVGGGKTAIDVCLWLLDHDVGPDQITWIRPRDAWLLDRRNIQPGGGSSMTSLITQLAASATSATVPELFDRLEADGNLLRIDESVTPTMYRCATITRKELDALAAIERVVRAGHVVEVRHDAVVLEHGEVPNDGATIIDCSADGLARRPPVDVFAGATITGQAVRTCQQVFSAAFIGHIEAVYDDEGRKNELCRPIPHPDDDLDWLRSTLAQFTNQVAWMGEPQITAWLKTSRLDPFSSPSGADPADSAELVTNVIGALENLPRLISAAEDAA